jgi:hypothetical protein
MLKATGDGTGHAVEMLTFHQTNVAMSLALCKFIAIMMKVTTDRPIVDP